MEHYLDVSALMAPEPLTRTLAASEALRAGEYLHMYHRMQPCHLFAQLDLRGFAYAMRSRAQGYYSVFIWRRSDPTAAAASEAARALPELTLRRAS